MGTRLHRVSVLASALALLFHSPAPLAQSVATGFTVEKIADGIYAAIRTEPPGLIADANSVFLVGPDDVIVVDTNLTPSSARATLAAIRTITNLPVATVVNTHWHDDHIIGNQVYRDAFPGARFVGHTTSAQDMRTTGASNRRQLLQTGPQMVQQLRMSIEQSKSMAGGDLTDEERRSYQADIARAERFFKEAPPVEIVEPTVIVADTLTITQGTRAIEIRHLGAGHTAADLVVHLPRERVLITGDLVVAPVPLVGSTSLPSAFAATLDALIALRPAIIVPGHGPVMRDDIYLRKEARLLKSLVSQVRAAAARTSALPDVRKAVDLEALKAEFAGESRLLAFIFDFYVTRPGVEAALRELGR